MSERELSSSGRLRVGLLAAHGLVAKYLSDFIELQINVKPFSVHDPVLTSSPIAVREPSVIVIDLYDLPMPVSTYLDAYNTHPNRPGFLALDHFRPVSDIVRLLLSGFSGFLSYDQVPDSLGKAISSIADGETWATPEVMRTYIKLTSQRPVISELGAEALTKREEQIHDLLRKRYSNKEIAMCLGICESTVKFHVSNVLAKLKAAGRRELTQDKQRISPLRFRDTFNFRECG